MAHSSWGIYIIRHSLGLEKNYDLPEAGRGDMRVEGLTDSLGDMEEGAMESLADWVWMEV